MIFGLQNYNQMIYISDKQQERIKRKIKSLPNLFKSEEISIVFFQLVGTIILTYGWCVARYNHPINQHEVNASYQFLISCFYYFALSVAAPFSGGHLNPAVTVSRAILRINNNKKYYIIAQIVGALIGSGIAYLFFGVNPFFYWRTVNFGTLALDFAAQVFGSFIFVFFLLLITETNYMTGQYFRYLLISIFFLAGRIFTLRRSCINPAVAIAMQVFASIEKGNALLLIYSLILIIGQLAGAIVASYFFHYFYAPLKEGIAFQHVQMSHIEQENSQMPNQEYTPNQED